MREIIFINFVSLYNQRTVHNEKKKFSLFKLRYFDCLLLISYNNVQYTTKKYIYLLSFGEAHDFKLF